MSNFEACLYLEYFVGHETLKLWGVTSMGTILKYKRFLNKYYIYITWQWNFLNVSFSKFLFSEIKQRSYLLFFVSNSSWPQVYTFSKCATSRFEAIQSLVEYNLRSQNLRFWFGTSGGSRSWPYWIFDWICRYKMVQSSGNHAEFKGNRILKWFIYTDLLFKI